MVTLQLTDEQFQLLQAFVDKAGGYDSVQDKLGETAAEILGHKGDSEAEMEAEIDLVNSMFDAIGTPVEEVIVTPQA